MPSEDPEALANALVELAERSDEERERLGRAARSRIADQYSLDAVTRQYDDVYAAAAQAASRMEKTASAQ